MGSGRSRRDGARDVDPLADVRQVGVTLLVGPVGCGEEDTSSVTTAAPDWPGRVWSDLVRPGQVWSVVVRPRAALTFAGRHVDAFAVAAEWVRPPQGPGHVVEHRVVGPAETAVVLVGVEAQPPVVTLHFVHLQRLEGKTGSHTSRESLRPVVCECS